MKRLVLNNQGYSLVEVLIAISILLITIVGPLTIAQKGLQNAIFAKQQNTSFFLAQEGLESIVKMREDQALLAYVESQSTPDTSFDSWEDLETLDEDFSGNEICTVEEPCGINIEDNTLFSCADEDCNLYYHVSGRASYSHNNGGEPTPYRREIILDSNSDRIHVRSIVTWGIRTDQRVELETFVYNIYAN